MPAATRMIAMGAAPLMEGFALVGFETYPDADATQLESVLERLVRNAETALVFLEQPLAHGSGPWLARVRQEGGRIVITELPQLQHPAAYHPAVEDLVTAILGPTALDEQP
jgi:vacuolar-type H+-ATPase subunit F/Vma7